tara:strand:- start:1386 stop:1649 length:264 start_codon:yes stop_codon:yes gene_type:complete
MDSKGLIHIIQIVDAHRLILLLYKYVEAHRLFIVMHIPLPGLRATSPLLQGGREAIFPASKVGERLERERKRENTQPNKKAFFYFYF